jgi:putative membrane protein
MARRHGRHGRQWALVFATSSVMTSSAIYEIFEWTLTLFVSPEQAHRYNGQQGDPFDAQKDMALALLGVFVFGVALAAGYLQKRSAERLRLD